MLKLIAILIAALAAPVLAAVPTVSVVSQTVNENAGTATVRIIRTGDLSKPSQIGFKTINGTALAGVNFTYRSGGVWFPALTNSYRFTVPILVDHKVTPDLKFTVRLSAVLNAQLLGGTITIHNTDLPPPVPTTAPIAPGGYAQVLAAEQAAPKSTSYTYGEGVYRTVQAGEVVHLGASYPDFGCLCAGQPREWAAYGSNGGFIGYLWEANLRGVQPAATPGP